MTVEFLRKPYSVKAIKFTGDNILDVEKLFENRFARHVTMEDYTKIYFINSMEGGMEDWLIVTDGKWIVEDYWKLNVMSEENFNKYYEADRKSVV